MNERGSVTAFVVIMTSALLAMAGLVIDGGYALAAHRRAFNEAEAAARAGAQAVDLDTLRATGDVVLDAEEAERRALEYLAALDRSGSVEVDGDVVRVHLSFEHGLVLLDAFGVGPMTIEGDGEARAVRGVTEAST
ncbi:MAG TPA: pilus assembly protein TadG-related protein [Acidimicrobiales bacterium]